MNGIYDYTNHGIGRKELTAEDTVRNFDFEYHRELVLKF